MMSQHLRWPPMRYCGGMLVLLLVHLTACWSQDVAPVSPSGGGDGGTADQQGLNTDASFLSTTTRYTFNYNSGGEMYAEEDATRIQRHQPFDGASYSFAPTMSSQLKCRPTIPGTPSPPHTVMILRISSQILQAQNPNTPIPFYVDSTIFKLTVQVNGSDAGDTLIWDPTGLMLNQRVKREAEPPPPPSPPDVQYSQFSSLQQQQQQHQHLEHYSNDKRDFNYIPSQHQQRYKRHQEQQQQQQLQQQQQQQQQQLNSERLQLLQKQTLSQETQNRQNLSYKTSDSRERYRYPLSFELENKLAEADERDQRNGDQRSLNMQDYNRTKRKKTKYSTIHRRKPSSDLHQRRQTKTKLGQGEISMLNFWPDGRGQDYVPSSKPGRSGRQKRTATMMSFEMLEDLAVWEVEPPMQGGWSISVVGPEPAQIIIRGISSLDFRVEFLDIRTMEDIGSQPVAYDTTLAKVYFYGLECLFNATVIELLNETGETIKTVEIDNTGRTLGQVSIDPNDPQNTALVFFTMPDIPFYMALTGYNVMGEKFYRVSPERVEPRLFVISLVDSKADPLVPGSDYKFGVRLRNKGRTDTFKITATFDDDQGVFTARTVPDVTLVGQNEITHIAVIVDIQPAITFFTTGHMTISATRLSDNITESLGETVTAMPKSFQVDYEAPACTTVFTSGGCWLHVACHLQHWNMSVAVADSLTGVKSAAFENAQLDAYTNVQYMSSMSNRTAEATYGFTCCSVEVSLSVQDYADNTGTCKLIAPVLGNAPDITTVITSRTTTTTTTTTSPSLPLASLAPTVSKSTAGTESSTKVAGTESPTTTQERPLHTPVTIQQTPTASNSFGTSKSSSVSSSLLSVIVSRPTRASAAMNGTSSRQTTSGPYQTTEPGQGQSESYGIISTTEIRSTSQDIGNQTTKPLRSLPTWDDPKFSTLRTAAIVCGCIAGVAGLGIVFVCIVYKCVNKKGPTRPGRQNSNDSDVTMGSSWESRSESSAGNDSIRMQQMFLNDRGSWSSRSGQGGDQGESSHSKSPKDNRGLISSEDTRKSTHAHQISRGVPETSSTDLNDKRVVGVRNGKYFIPRRDEDVEDVTYRCVVVKAADSNQNNTAASPKDGRRTDVSASSPDVSYSPLLASGGKTYTSMLEVQRRMEDMERQRRSLSEEANSNALPEQNAAEAEGEEASHNVVDESHPSQRIIFAHRENQQVSDGDQMTYSVADDGHTNHREIGDSQPNSSAVCGDHLSQRIVDGDQMCHRIVDIHQLSHRPSDRRGDTERTRQMRHNDTPPGSPQVHTDYNDVPSMNRQHLLGAETISERVYAVQRRRYQCDCCSHDNREIQRAVPAQESQQQSSRGRRVRIINPRYHSRQSPSSVNATQQQTGAEGRSVNMTPSISADRSANEGHSPFREEGSQDNLPVGAEGTSLRASQHLRHAIEDPAYRAGNVIHNARRTVQQPSGDTSYAAQPHRARLPQQDVYNDQSTMGAKISPRDSPSAADSQNTRPHQSQALPVLDDRNPRLHQTPPILRRQVLEQTLPHIHGRPLSHHMVSAGRDARRSYPNLSSQQAVPSGRSVGISSQQVNDNVPSSHGRVPGAAAAAASDDISIINRGRTRPLEIHTNNDSALAGAGARARTEQGLDRNSRGNESDIRAAGGQHINVSNGDSVCEENDDIDTAHRPTPGHSHDPSQDGALRQRANSAGSRMTSQQAMTSAAVMSGASQLALRQDIEHIRQKLLRFQRRIDHEIEEEERRSRSHSPCSSGNHSNVEDD